MAWGNMDGSFSCEVLSVNWDGDGREQTQHVSLSARQSTPPMIAGETSRRCGAESLSCEGKRDVGCRMRSRKEGGAGVHGVHVVVG